MPTSQKRKRRRKRRGTQGGSIDRRGPRGRPRNRAEARARARSRSSKKPQARQDRVPTWRGAVNRGLFAAAIFLGLLLLFFKQPVASAIGLSAFMLIVYIPMGYYLDRFFYRLRQRRDARQREQTASEK